MVDELCCCFRRHTPVVARIPREIQLDRGRGVEKFISKLRNSRGIKNIYFSWISV